MGILRSLWNLPPRAVALKIRSRFASKASPFHAETLLSSPKLRPQRFYDFLHRYEAILQRTCGWKPIDFVGARVLELGCGPLLGWGPLAVFRGADSYAAIEPNGNASALRSGPLQERYFLNVHKDLSAIYGVDTSTHEFLTRMRERIVVHPTVLADFHGNEHFDIILSNSCLEHIAPLEASILRLREIAAPDCRFLHLVDFGNHRGTANPFAGMYSVEPKEYISHHDDGLNLKRAPDMLACFRTAGFDADLTIYTDYQDTYGNTEPICTYWQDRYDCSELFIKAALIHGSTG